MLALAAALCGCSSSGTSRPAAAAATFEKPITGTWPDPNFSSGYPSTDPCTLLTVADLQASGWAALDKDGPSSTQRRYDSKDWGPGCNYGLVGVYYLRLGSSVTDGVPVSGYGDEARYSKDLHYMWVRQGQTWVQIDGGFLDNSSADVLGKLAIAALSRV